MVFSKTMEPGLFGPTSLILSCSCNNSVQFFQTTILSDLYKAIDFKNWTMGGGFNLITTANGKDEGNPIDIRLSDRFIDTINNCNLNNIGFSENIFMWAKQGNFIQVRLSIFLISQNGWRILIFIIIIIYFVMHLAIVLSYFILALIIKTNILTTTKGRK